MSKRTAAQKISQFVKLGVLGGGVCGGLLLQRHDDRASKILAYLSVNVMGTKATWQTNILALSRGYYFKSRLVDNPEFRVKLWGREFSNPVGVAMDKNGEAVQGFSDLGFGFVQVGPVTPQPQPQTCKCNMIKSDGYAMVRQRLEQVRAGGFSGVLGVGLGKSTMASEEADHCEGVRQFAHLADYLVIGISVKSKNDPKSLIQALLKARQDLKLSQPPALVIEICCGDWSEDDLKDIAEVITSPGSQVDGLIMSQKNNAIRDMHRMTGGKVPIIGGKLVLSGEDAMQTMRAGASLVRMHGEFLVRGQACATNIRRELGELLAKDGVENIIEWVGAENKDYMTETRYNLPSNSLNNVY